MGKWIVWLIWSESARWVARALETKSFGVLLIDARYESCDYKGDEKRLVIIPWSQIHYIELSEDEGEVEESAK